MLTCKYCAHLKKCIEDANKNGCEHNDDFEGEGFCPFYGFKRKTNADRIRAMSDKELAEALLTGQYGFGCDVCSESFEVKCSCECTERLTEWLKQPVKDGDNE